VSGWPFTHHEIQRIHNVTELIDNVITRSRLTMQAAQNARVEHLAMMSRGLAHDLKNLITPISTFLIHTDDKSSDPNSPEAQVHAAARRSVGIMAEYVREALFFSERLAPKIEPIAIKQLLCDVRTITESRAVSREIMIVTEADFSAPFMSDAVLLQRTLANLVVNAIDASRPGQTVLLSASVGPGCLRLKVTDNGCGIPSNHVGRIFDPYFTTKEHGENVRGFGLGLTISQKIIHVLGGSISVQSAVGRGTTLTIDLPLTPNDQPSADTSPA
jgi:signal transduction histidine kinase